MSIRQVIPALRVTLNRRSHLSGDNGHRGYSLQLPDGARREPEEAGRNRSARPWSPWAEYSDVVNVNRAASQPAPFVLVSDHPEPTTQSRPSRGGFSEGFLGGGPQSAGSASVTKDGATEVTPWAPAPA